MSKNKITKALILAMILVSDLEELEQQGAFKHQAKKSVKKAVIDLERIINGTMGKVKASYTPESYKEVSEAFSDLSLRIDDLLNEKFEV